MKFDSTGNLLENWENQGSEEGAFNSLGFGGIAIDSDDNVFVVDNGNFLRKWGGEGSEEGQFMHATGITADRKGHIYVAEYEGRRLQKFDSEGNFITSWQVGGDVLGTPGGLAVDQQGNVYVSDYRLAQVEEYTADGEFLTRWGERGTGDMAFQVPVALAIDSAGNIFVSDQKTNSVQKIAVSQ